MDGPPPAQFKRLSFLSLFILSILHYITLQIIIIITIIQ